MEWFRYYNETVFDQKLRLIARKTAVPLTSVLAHWSTILAYASASPMRGVLMITMHSPLSCAAVSETLQCTSDETEQLFQAFQDEEMLVLQDGALAVANWDRRQFISDQSTRRVRKCRESKQQRPVTETGQKRDGNVSGTPQIQIQSTEEEREGEGGSAAPAPSLSSREKCFKIFDLLWTHGKSTTNWEMVADWIEDYGAEEVLEVLEDMRARKIINAGVMPYLRKTLSSRAAERRAPPEEESWVPADAATVTQLENERFAADTAKWEAEERLKEEHGTAVSG